MVRLHYIVMCMNLANDVSAARHSIPKAQDVVSRSNVQVPQPRVVRTYQLAIQCLYNVEAIGIVSGGGQW